MTLEDWANVATVVAGMGAIIAAAIAVVAIIQARRLQDEKSQPYVVAVMESNPHMPEMLELAFRNVGETAAHDVEVSIDPAPPQPMPAKASCSSIWRSRRASEAR